MRLKCLDLQGYKTFATRTSFAFDGGITAIVGPNGSGKSNIADAIRWVLGEQSYRALRGKRTEDMIFSGSAQRARLGMAAASLTLDNSDGWLPIDFAEVTITRRAYRSGENEYLLNGSRVRLRDIGELLATSGLARRTYTVVGQGLVDAVLSLRPEDRRELFEEASGISLYQLKRAEALSRLEETRSNLLRANDIVNEIAPRLHRLEREAERARHHAMLSQQLEGLLRTWYGYRWRQEQQNLRRAQDSLARREAALARRHESLDELDRRMAAVRARQAQLREQLGGWHRESSALHHQMEEVQRDLAVLQERARLLARQHDELQGELAELEAQAQAASERTASAEAEAAGCEEAFRDEEAFVAEAQAALDAFEDQRADLSRKLAKAQTEALDLAGQANDRRSRLDRVDERRKVLVGEHASHEAALAEHGAAAELVAAQMEIVVAEQARLQSEQEALSTDLSNLEAELATIQASQAEFQASLAEAQRGYDRLQARYELLSRLRVEGEGLHAGVRAVLQAASQTPLAPAPIPNPLSGIVGTVAQLVHAPAEYEIAIEVALGGHLQDLIVESWLDAERAIAYLREGQWGRATFLPLDTVRPVPRLELPQDEDVVGVGVDLVHVEGRLTRVAEMLLGRTVVTTGLKAARRIFDRLQGGFQIVTLAGEVLRSSGSVTGGEGRGQAQGQVLAREREWRELPAHLQAARSRGREIEADLAQAQAVDAKMREQLAELDQRRRAGGEILAQAQARQQDLSREAERTAQQMAWRRELMARLEDEEQGLDALESSLRAELTQLAAERQAMEQQVAAHQASLEQLRGDLVFRRLSEARTAAAVAQERWERRQAELDTWRRSEARLHSQVEAKRQRIDALEAERDSLAEQVARQASREAVVQGWLASLSKKIEPAEAGISRLDVEREQLEKEETGLRIRLREAESNRSQALLTASRQEDKLERLRRQIMDDFGLVQMEFTDGLAEQPPLPLGEMVSALPWVESLPEGLEDEIHQLKAQVRRMGAVNPDAPDEYAEVLDRYTFLTTQATDLEEAARSLREVISELDDVMRQEFHSTFAAVAERFRENFTQLFGGGAAHLLLTDPDDVSQTGVEIVARSPGKRQQPLALLSGGERSLTAVALIFSILEVSPPPFCILDEVDAMLDEANVKRFREALEALAQRTQFIVITHNRGTIQAADTIYGVSMGDDSVSQVVSLRLEGDRIAAPDGSLMDVKAG
jgi:chromosome segregation protein